MSRSTRYRWPTTTCATCSRKGTIQRPSSLTSSEISWVDFIRACETECARRMFDQTAPGIRGKEGPLTGLRCEREILAGRASQYKVPPPGFLIRENAQKDRRLSPER